MRGWVTRIEGSPLGTGGQCRAALGQGTSHDLLKAARLVAGVGQVVLGAGGFLELVGAEV